MKNRRKTDADWDGTEALVRAVRTKTVEQCIVIVLRHFGNDYSGVKCLAELEKLK